MEVDSLKTNSQSTRIAFKVNQYRVEYIAFALHDQPQNAKTSNIRTII